VCSPCADAGAENWRQPLQRVSPEFHRQTGADAVRRANRGSTPHTGQFNAAPFAILGFAEPSFANGSAGTVNYHIEKSSTFGDARLVRTVGKGWLCAPQLWLLSHFSL